MASMHVTCRLSIVLLLQAKVLIAVPGLQHSCSAWGTSSADGSGCSAWLQRKGRPLQQPEEEQLAFARYVATCRGYGIQPSADVLNRLQLRSGRLALQHHSSSSRCGDLDVRALVLLLEDNDGLLLSNLREMDLSQCKLGISSVMLIASLLQHPRSCLETLDLSNQYVSSEGACAIAAALPLSPSLGPKVLRLKEAWLLDEGGGLILNILRNASAHRLQVLDLQNNFISFRTCRDLQKVAAANGVNILLQGNRVLDQILNAVTHGLGELLVMVGCGVMAVSLQGKAKHVKVATVIYLVSLNVLYLCSTLFHSFFALGQETVYVFKMLDFSGIFILIAGSYTPFLAILFHGQRWAECLLGFLWVAALCGILTAAFYHGPFQLAIRLSFFLGMGWTALACITRIIREVGCKGTVLLVAGGIMYTAGVPFFVKNGHTFGFPDHAIWHLFVIAASILHYLCILWYVVERSGNGAEEIVDGRHPDSPTAGKYLSMLWSGTQVY